MAIILDKVLTSDLTFSLLKDEISYIQIHGNIATCLLSAKIDASGAYTVEATIASTEYLEMSATTYASVKWEPIKVSGVEYPELTFDVNSVIFNSPNVLRIKNTSAGSQALLVSLRGNR